MATTHAQPWRRVGSIAFLFATALTVGGCHAAPRTLDTRDAAGVYTLASIDGKELPATVKHGDDVVEVRSGKLTIGTDGTCLAVTNFVPPSGRVITREVRADCVVEGERWTMRWKGAGTTDGTLVGTTFTMKNEGLNFVYRK